VYNLFYLDLIYFIYTQSDETFTVLYIGKIITAFLSVDTHLKIKLNVN